MYEIVSFKVVWYAELGTCDDTGLWQVTNESEPFSTKEEAENYIKKYEGIDLTYWGEYRPPWSYGLTRVRRALEEIKVKGVIDVD